MKNSSNCLLQFVKWSSRLAALVLAVSLSQTARAQINNLGPLYTISSPLAVLTDVGPSNRPPIPGPNDYYQTNTLYETQLVNLPGWDYVINEGGITSPTVRYTGNQFGGNGPGGETFVTANVQPDAHGNGGIAITNLYVQIAATPWNGNISGGGSYAQGGDLLTTNLPLTNVQPFMLNFYQLAGTSDPSHLPSNATFIASITTTPARINALGDWLSFSNFVVFLQPGTTNAFTWSNTTNGYGYAALPVVTNSGETTSHLQGGPFSGGYPVIITNIPGAYTANYGITAGLQNGLYVTNYDTVFSIGVATNFIEPIFTTNPVSYNLAAGVTMTNNANFLASGSGSSNSLYGIGGYWIFSSVSTPGTWTPITTTGAVANGGVVSSVSVTANGPAVVNAQGQPLAGVGGANVQGSLSIVNPSSSSAGSYALVITNWDGVAPQPYASTSAVATISFINPMPATGFASTVVSNAATYGTVAYWPLNETVDPSTGMAVAYEWINGLNGVYMWNSANSVGNALNGLPPAPGPAAASNVGFAPGGSLCSGGDIGFLPFAETSGGLPTTNELPLSFVNVPVAPQLTGIHSTPPNPGAVNATNYSIVMWVNPNQSEPTSTGLMFWRPYSSVGDGIGYSGGAANNLGYAADNNRTITSTGGYTGSTGNWASGLNVPTNVWSMVALVVTPNAATVYIGNTNVGMMTASCVLSGSTFSNAPWGQAVIGTDTATGQVSARNFDGYISSVAMFSNSLTAFQIGALLAAGQGNVPPLIVTNIYTEYPDGQLPCGRHLDQRHCRLGLWRPHLRRLLAGQQRRRLG